MRIRRIRCYFYLPFCHWDSNISPLSFFSPNLLMYPSLLFLEFTVLFFSTHCYYNKQLSLYNVFMCIFRANYLTLDKELICLSLGKTTSPAFSFSHLLIVLYEGLNLKENASAQRELPLGPPIRHRPHLDTCFPRDPLLRGEDKLKWQQQMTS